MASLPVSADTRLTSLGCRTAIALCLILVIYGTYVAVTTHTSTTSLYSRNVPMDSNISRVSDVKEHDDKYIDITRFLSFCEPRILNGLSKSLDSRGMIQAHVIKSSKRSHCPRNLIQASSSMYRMWLLSFPGSGNSWTRHLLQQMTGLVTGSVYHESVLHKNGFPYENRTRHVVAIKIHALQHAMTRKQIHINAKEDRLILLIRNPYWSLLSEYKKGPMNLKYTGNAYIDNRNKCWSKYVETMVPRWSRTIVNAMQSNITTMIVFYEDLQAQLLKELVRMAAFIKSESLKNFAFCCTLHQREGRFHRSPSNQTVVDVYTKEDKELVNSMLLKLVGIIQHDNPKVAKRLLRYILLS